MKKNYNFISFFLLFTLWVTPSLASESGIHWFRLEKRFTYKDLEQYCTTAHMPISILFGAELVNGKAKAAVFKTDTFEPLSEKLAFNTGELEGVKFSFEQEDVPWIKSINLSSRQLEWIFTHGIDLDACVPPQKLTTMSPNKLNFTFDLSQMLTQPKQVTSNEGRFSGQRKDGRYYQARLSFVQKLVKH